jgi:hypothetical protein
MVRYLQSVSISLHKLRTRSSSSAIKIHVGAGDAWTLDDLDDHGRPRPPGAATEAGVAPAGTLIGRKPTRSSDQGIVRAAACVAEQHRLCHRKIWHRNCNPGADLHWERDVTEPRRRSFPNRLGSLWRPMFGRAPWGSRSDRRGGRRGRRRVVHHDFVSSRRWAWGEGLAVQDTPILGTAAL